MRENDNNGSQNEKERPRVTSELAARVKEQALNMLPPRQRQSTNLYLDPFVLEAGKPLGPAFQRWNVDRPSVLVFQDDEPKANFGHPCGYLLFDARTGKPVHQIRSQFPPYPKLGLRGLDAWWQPVKTQNAQRRRAGGAARALAPQMRRSGHGTGPGAGKHFAILFAGNAEQVHLNDLELSYRMLIDVFHFDPKNIQVLFHDGTRHGAPWLEDDGSPRLWPGSDTDPDFRIQPNAAGTRDTFKAALLKIKKHLGTNDSLFIHTEGHGGHDDGTPNEKAFLAGCSEFVADSQYFAFDLGADLHNLKPFRSLLALMNQCYAGGFNESVVNGSKAAQTFIASASFANALSYPAEEREGNWNDFSLDWLEAQMGERVDETGLPVDPDTDSDGSIGAREAFEYALSQNEQQDTPNFDLKPDPNAGSISLR